MAYSYGQLQQLWVQNGGPPAVAGLMAAIGLAESGGDPGATNPASGACGLWQINPAEGGCYDPQANARMAVRKYNEQGLGAWESYTNGGYRRYYQGADRLGAAGSVTAASSDCAYSFPLFGGPVCLDLPVGVAAAGAGLVGLALGLALLARELR